MRKNISIGLLTAWVVLCAILLKAQEIGKGSDDTKPIEERILYSHQNSLSATLHTQGLGLGFQIGRIRSIYKLTEWEFGLYTLRSRKQIKMVGTVQFGARPYVYGKLNEVLVIRGGYGQQRRLYGRPYWGGVELRWHYAAGVSLAIMKPYYYSVKVMQPVGDGTFKKVEAYQPFDSVASWIEIIGRAPFKEGLNTLHVAPGGYLKGGLVFDFSIQKTRAQAIETGVVLECFPTGLSLMADPKNLSKDPRQCLFFTFYLSYHWGRRFNNNY